MQRARLGSKFSSAKSSDFYDLCGHQPAAKYLDKFRRFCSITRASPCCSASQYTLLSGTNLLCLLPSFQSCTRAAFAVLGRASLWLLYVPSTALERAQMKALRIDGELRRIPPHHSLSPFWHPIILPSVIVVQRAMHYIALLLIVGSCDRL